MLNVDQCVLANRHLWYGLKLLDDALCAIERRLERGSRIVVTVKSTLAGRISPLRFEPAWFQFVLVLDLVLHEDPSWPPLVHKEVHVMLGMTFLSFLVLTVIGAVVAVAYHNVIRYRFLEGNDALFGKLIVGWLGAWLGSPVFGHWFWKIENVYVVPAILGAIAAVQLIVLMGKVLAKLASMRPAVIEDRKEELRPVRPAVAA